jgi:hypothetical protein
MSTREVAARYRLYAAYCGEAAQDAADSGRKVALLNMAQGWAKLAEQIEKNNTAAAETESQTPAARSEH